MKNLTLKQTVKVDVAVVIFVCCTEHCIELVVGWTLPHLDHHWLQLILLNVSIAVQIELFEYSTQVIVFYFSIAINLQLNNNFNHQEKTTLPRTV